MGSEIHNDTTLQNNQRREFHNSSPISGHLNGSTLSLKSEKPQFKVEGSFSPHPDSKEDHFFLRSVSSSWEHVEKQKSLKKSIQEVGNIIFDLWSSCVQVFIDDFGDNKYNARQKAMEALFSDNEGIILNILSTNASCEFFKEKIAYLPRVQLHNWKRALCVECDENTIEENTSLDKISNLFLKTSRSFKDLEDKDLKINSEQIQNFVSLSMQVPIIEKTTYDKKNFSYRILLLTSEVLTEWDEEDFNDFKEENFNHCEQKLSKKLYESFCVKDIKIKQELEEYYKISNEKKAFFGDFIQNFLYALAPACWSIDEWDEGFKNLPIKQKINFLMEFIIFPLLSKEAEEEEDTPQNFTKDDVLTVVRDRPEIHRLQTLQNDGILEASEPKTQTFLSWLREVFFIVIPNKFFSCIFYLRGLFFSP